MAFLESLMKGGVEGVVDSFGSSIQKAVSAFKADPTKVMEFETQIAQATVQFQSSVIASVNATMQAEAKSEHWMVWSWRPSFGFTACGVLINNYLLLPYFKPLGIIPIEVPSEVWIMIMAVLGVAAWTRGQEKIAKI